VTRPSWVVLANANAGTAERESVASCCSALRRIGEVDPVETEDAAEIDGELDRLAGRRLVVAGGDGSIHAVVAALWRRGELGATPLGIVPLGTGNDLARTLGLPLDAAEAAEVVHSGVERRLDLVVADDGPVVVNAAHAGLGAVAAEAGASLKDRLGQLAYPIGAVLAAVRERGWELTVEVDGRAVVDGEAVLLAGVGNGRTIGGGTPMFPSADPGDGLLEVVVSTAVGPAARVAFGAALRDGSHVDRDDVVTARGRRVRIAGDPVPHNLDGEVGDPLPDRTYRVEPAAWAVVVPG
jgi:YegS/Rv2252/BmrU family lipid kinase